MFVSFDGVDGVGKSTQLELFCRWLESLGKTVVSCRDPGSTPLGERVRDIVLHSDDATPIGGRAEMLLYMAARAQLVEEVIRPALLAGSVVVADRFLLANVVYQAHAGGLPVDEVWQVGKVATGGIEPDATLLLDMDPAIADGRIERTRDRMETRGDDYRQKVREGFLAEAARSERIHVIDANQSIDDVQADIRRAVEPLLDA
ncbi:MAG: dTMP kinase [Planctomycetota bacterium]